MVGNATTYFLANPRLGPTFQVGDFEMIVDDVGYMDTIPDTYLPFQADEGTKYIVVDVIVKNIGKFAAEFLGMIERHYLKSISPPSTLSTILPFSVPLEIADVKVPLTLEFKKGMDRQEYSIRLRRMHTCVGRTLASHFESMARPGPRGKAAPFWALLVSDRNRRIQQTLI